MNTTEKILKWCGLTNEVDIQRACVNSYFTVDLEKQSVEPNGVFVYEPLNWREPDGAPCLQPALDMNFFFKWVVPRLISYEIDQVRYKRKKQHVAVLTSRKGFVWTCIALTPEQAWQGALLKLIRRKP